MFWLKRICLTVLAVVLIVPLAFFGFAMMRESQTLDQALPTVGRLVETVEGRIFVLDEGPEDGPVLLFAHGTAAWSGLWQPVLEAAAEGGFRAIAYDLPPFGYSDRDPQARYGRVDQAARIAVLVDAMEIRPILVAHSFGAGPGVEAVMRRPNLFAGLVVVDGAIGPGADTEATLPLPLRLPVLRRVIVSSTLTNPLLTRRGLAMLVQNRDAATSERARLLQAPMRRQGTTAAYADWLPTLLAPSTDAFSMQRENYATLTLPVAYIWGAEDTVTPLEQGRELADLTPGAELFILSDVGHIPQIEAPEEFLDVLFSATRAMTSEHR